jgi:hypothetical protein
MTADYRTERHGTAQPRPGGAWENSMSRVRRIAELPAGSRARWLFVGLWVVVLGAVTATSGHQGR